MLVASLPRSLALSRSAPAAWLAQLQLVWLVLRKELRELCVGRTLWAMLAVEAPLVGFGFQQSIYLYSEASKSALRLPNLISSLAPTQGVIVPTLGALYLVNTFLFPFLAIRAIGAERQHGGLKLLLQLPLGPGRLVAIKALALGLAWSLTLVPGLSAVAFWLALGGHLALGDLLAVLLGHALYALVVAAIAFLMATLAESSATAAILTLAVTLGSWALDFAGGTQGGLVHTLASFSLTTALRTLEHGLLSSPQLLAPIIVAAALFGLSALWLPSGAPRRRKALGSAALVALASVAIFLALRFPAYADVSETRQNSFNPADERALRAMDQVLHITVYLAPTDSRRQDLETNVLSKLQRVVPHLVVDTPQTGTTGLFGGTPGDRYGTVQYDYAGQSVTSRATSAGEILPLLHGLAGQQVTPDPLPAYPGYPTVADTRGLVWWFYALLPALALAGWRFSQRPPASVARLGGHRRGLPGWATTAASLVLALGLMQTLVAVYLSRQAAVQQAGVVITVRDDGFSPRLFTIDGGEGQRFVLRLVNTGAEPHQVAIAGLNAQSGIIPPGQTGTLDFVSTTEGTYRIIDPLPGHEQAGMVGYITID